jgi:hypothetical protein
MNRIQVIASILKNPMSIILILGDKGLFNWVPDKSYLKLVYWGEMGQKLNLEKPKTFNEKLQWLKIHDRKPVYNEYVDKFAVRAHIAKTIGEQYLVPIIGLYTNVEVIDWNELPNQFVLKCTHGSSSNIICSDKNSLDIEKSKKKLRKWMKKNWYWFGREWPYKDVRPRIICEKFITETGVAPDDYKVLCFNGKAKLIEVHIDRFGDHKQDFYDINWKKTSISQGGTISNRVYPKPKMFEQMMYLSEKLASDLIHVRVDWYVVDNKLYFGELTFFDGAGFTRFDNEEDDLRLGSMINLPIEINVEVED